MKIVVLDAFHINPGDLSWAQLESVADVHIYDQSSQEELLQRAKGAEIILTNKVVLDKRSINQLADLRCICEPGTGRQLAGAFRKPSARRVSGSDNGHYGGAG